MIDIDWETDEDDDLKLDGKRSALLSDPSNVDKNETSDGILALSDLLSVPLHGDLVGNENGKGT